MANHIFPIIVSGQSSIALKIMRIAELGILIDRALQVPGRESMPRKRKSDPLPVRNTKSVRNLLDLVPTSSSTGDGGNNSGEDLEKLIEVIHEKFRKRTKEQKDQAERKVREMVQHATTTLERHVLDYEGQV